MSTIKFQLNGKAVTLASADPKMPLLYALREDFGLKGPRFGCGLGQCGACTVVVDGNAVRSCLTPVSVVAGKAVRTLDGLAENGRLDPLQQAFIDEQAVQCGYCTNGMIMTAKALLEREKRPTRTQIVEALDGNLCRCGTQPRVVRAIERAAAAMKK
jgi:nicotinate dehydrogenase subunit A